MKLNWWVNYVGMPVQKLRTGKHKSRELTPCQQLLKTVRRATFLFKKNRVFLLLNNTSTSFLQFVGLFKRKCEYEQPTFA